MPFKPPKKDVQFADLKGILAQFRETGNPLYQTVEVLIDRLSQSHKDTRDKIEQVKDSIKSGGGGGDGASKTASYVTENDETSKLPNSVQLVAGTGITLDSSVANRLIINAIAPLPSGYAPMSTGAEPLEIMSDGAGSVLMIGFSE